MAGRAPMLAIASVVLRVRVVYWAIIRSDRKRSHDSLWEAILSDSSSIQIRVVPPPDGRRLNNVRQRNEHRSNQLHSREGRTSSPRT